MVYTFYTFYTPIIAFVIMYAFNICIILSIRHIRTCIITTLILPFCFLQVSILPTVFNYFHPYIYLYTIGILFPPTPFWP